MTTCWTIRDFGAWKDFVHDNFPWLEMRNRCNNGFRAEVGACRLSSGTLTSMHLAASEVRRTRSLADSAEAGYIKIMAQVSGRIEVEQDRRSCLILPGQATVCDSARPYSIRIDNGARFAVLMLPYAACPGWEQISQRICGSLLPDAMTVRSALAALAVLEPVSGGSEPNGTVLRAVEWMLSSVLTQSASLPALTPEQGSKLHRVERYIEQHLDDPALDVDDLAAAICMSRRALYMLFQQHGTTPLKLIQQVRLGRSRQLLEDAAQRGRKITDIAFDCGFNDYATFSRLFKQRYGLTPRELRGWAILPRH